MVLLCTLYGSMRYYTLLWFKVERVGIYIIGWRDGKILQNALKVCALDKTCSYGARDPLRESNTYLTEPVPAARGAAPR